MSQCTGRYCIPASKFQHPEDPDGPFRYLGEQCKKLCAEGSNLCTGCLKKKGVKGQWHGYIHGELPADSHIEGSEWNLKHRAKHAAKLASEAMGVAASAPKAKKSVKKVMKALEEVKEAEKELEEARSNAVSALKAAEINTNNVAAEVLRKSSSGSKHANRTSAKKSPSRVVLGMAQMYISSSPKKAKTARKTAKKSSPSRVALGMAEMYSSSSSPKKARKTAKKPSRTALGMAEMYSSSSSPKKAKPARKPRTAKKRTPSPIYRPASASGSPMGAAARSGYATPVSSGSPQRRFVEVPSMPSYSNAAPGVSMLAGPPLSSNSSSAGSNYSQGNLTLQ